MMGKHMLKNIRVAIVAVLAAGLIGIVTPELADAADDGFESIFDGKTLKNWNGNPKFWSVKDGAITGQTTKGNPTQGNTFIIWKGADLGDFELKLQYKIVGGNSGIQYRSFKLPGKNDGWRIGGYQADFEAGNTYSGIVYGEAFRGILCNRGLKTELVRAGGKFQVKTIKRLGDSKAIQAKIKKEDWNDYHITAKGFHLVQRINGVVTADCTDNDAKQRRATGLLALQLHAGPPFSSARSRSSGWARRRLPADCLCPVFPVCRGSAVSAICPRPTRWPIGWPMRPVAWRPRRFVRSWDCPATSVTRWWRLRRSESCLRRPTAVS